MSTSTFHPKVSIVIPVYNGSNYLREAIESALAQTYDNLEVIVVNDGSTDGGATEQIALAYGDRIRYFHKRNGGVATALNLGIEKMTGEYFSWLSHDDYYDPEKLKVQVDFIAKNGLAGDRIFLTSDYTTVGKTNVYTSSSIRDIADVVVGLFSSKFNFCSALVDRKTLTSVGGFEIDKKTTQDYVLLFKLMKQGVRFYNINQSLIYSRHHEEQGVHTMLPLHIKELNSLYSWGFDYIFEDFFRDCDLCVLKKIARIVEQRGLTEPLSLVYPWLGFKEAQVNGKMIIWQYWENAPNKSMPDYIQVCHASVDRHAKNDFVILRMNEKSIKYFLPDLRADVTKLKQIAHRADYIRFKLLFAYGGVWLDSDILLIDRLSTLTDKIGEFGFVCTGYHNEAIDKLFPIIFFLGATKGNSICKELIERMDIALSELEEETLDWDAFSGLPLADILHTLPGNEYYMYDVSIFSPVPTHFNPDDLLKPIDNAFVEKCNSAVGQALANSVMGEQLEAWCKDNTTDTEEMSAISYLFSLASGQREKGALGVVLQNMPRDIDSVSIDNLSSKEIKIIRFIRRIKKNKGAYTLYSFLIRPAYRMLKKCGLSRSTVSL